MKKLSWLLMPVLLFLSVLPAAASEVMLKNGDRVSGKIVEETEEAVVLETEYAGKVTISREHIDRIANAPAVKPTTEARIEKAAYAENAPAKEPVKPAETFAQPKPPARRLFGGRYMGVAEGWEGNANVGFSFTSGNSANTTLTTSVQAVKSGARDNLTVYARSLWNTNRNSGNVVTTQNAFWGGARYDRNFGEGQFGFVSYDFESDWPQQLNFRSVLGGGIGRHAIRNETTELDVLTGSAWNRTWQRGANTDTPEAIAGATLKHKFHDRLKLQKTFTYYQNTADRTEYRILFDATVSADVTKRVGLFITFGDRFNNDPIGNSRKNDFLVTTGMKWNFGRRK